jgi:hypothetical protein
VVIYQKHPFNFIQYSWLYIPFNRHEDSIKLLFLDTPTALTIAQISTKQSHIIYIPVNQKFDPVGVGRLVKLKMVDFQGQTVNLSEATITNQRFQENHVTLMGYYWLIIVAMIMVIYY